MGWNIVRPDESNLPDTFRDLDGLDLSINIHSGQVRITIGFKDFESRTYQLFPLLEPPIIDGPDLINVENAFVPLVRKYLTAIGGTES